MKRALARFFFAAGRAYIHARRVLDGVSLEFAHTAPSMLRVMAATFAAAVLYPLYRCEPRAKPWLHPNDMHASWPLAALFAGPGWHGGAALSVACCLEFATCCLR